MHNHHETHLLHYDIKKNLDLYIINIFRAVATGLSILFIPILLYNDFDYGFTEIMIYYILQSGTSLIMYSISAKIIDVYGSKMSIIIGLFFLIIHFSIWGFVDISGSVIYLLGILYGLFMSFFWLGYHYNRALHGHKNKEWWAIAKLNIVMTFLWAITPLIWGFIIQNFAYHYIFYVSIVLTLIAILLVFHSSQKHKSIHITAKKIIKYGKTDALKKLSLGFSSFGYIGFMGGVFRPLYIYLIIPNFSKIGFISSITSIITIILLYFVGKELNKQNDKKILKNSTNFQLINWIAWGFFAVLQIFNGAFITIIDTIHRLTHNINITCLTKSLYTVWEEKIIKETPENISFYGIFFHEASVHLSRILLLSVFALASIRIPDTTMIHIAIICGIIIIPLQKIILKR